jgi:hypothetical protein
MNVVKTVLLLHGAPLLQPVSLNGSLNRPCSSRCHQLCRRSGICHLQNESVQEAPTGLYKTVTCHACLHACIQHWAVRVTPKLLYCFSSLSCHSHVSTPPSQAAAATSSASITCSRASCKPAWLVAALYCCCYFSSTAAETAAAVVTICCLTAVTALPTLALLCMRLLAHLPAQLACDNCCSQASYHWWLRQPAVRYCPTQPSIRRRCDMHGVQYNIQYNTIQWSAGLQQPGCMTTARLHTMVCRSATARLHDSIGCGC